MPTVIMLFRDLFMDISILASVQLCFGRLSIRRLIIALIPLQLSSLLVLCFGTHMRNPFLVGISCLSAAYALVKSRNIGTVFATAAGILFSTIIAAGLMELLGDSFSIIALSTLIIIPLILRRRMHICYRWHINVLMEISGHKQFFRALIDTGNRLREPLTGLPVLIVSSDVIAEDMLADQKLRYLTYGVLGSDGKLPAFRAESVRISQRGSRFIYAPDCYIAVFPGKIPGGLQALAPPEFTEVLSPVSLRRRTPGRRKKYAVFQHQAIDLRSGSSNQEGLGLLYRRE